MAHRVRVVVSGATGRMGREIGRLAAGGAEVEIAAGIAPDEHTGEAPAGYPTLVPAGEAVRALRDADVWIDFSAPGFLRRLLEGAGESGDWALVVGTTGLGAEEEALLERHAGVRPVLTAANFSVGVNVLLSLVRQAAAALEGYDAEIVEAHHRRKEDAPSGTALALGEALAEGRGVRLDEVRRDGRSGRPGARPAGEIGFHALRGGEVVGDHHVHFLGELDRLELVHRAGDRALFAAGALRAARWLSGRPAGRYEMRDVLGLA
jgi:4-hydroxy-tetrahydrodipicolinate reductase